MVTRDITTNGNNKTVPRRYVLLIYQIKSIATLPASVLMIFWKSVLLFLSISIQLDNKADTEVNKSPPVVQLKDGSREMEIRDFTTTPCMMGDIQIN